MWKLILITPVTLLAVIVVLNSVAPGKLKWIDGEATQQALLIMTLVTLLVEIGLYLPEMITLM
jgi:hypothetical protein